MVVNVSCGLVRFGAVWCSLEPFSTVCFGAVQFGSVRLRVFLFGLVRCTVACSAEWFGLTLCALLVRAGGCGKLRFGALQFGTVWCDVM